MSNTVDDIKAEELWKTLQRVDLEVADERKETRQAARRRQVAIHQTKDVVLPAPLSDEQVECNGKESPKLKEPQVPYSAGGSDDQEDSGDDANIIAIIGEVLALQAKTNSDYWSVAWKTASKAMNTEVQLADVIGKSVKESWNQQANMSESESKTALVEGISMAVAAGGALIMGGYGAYKDGEMTIKPDNDALVTDKTEEALAKKGMGTGENALEKAQANENAVKKLNSRALSPGGSALFDRMKDFYAAYSKSANGFAGAQMFASASSGFANWQYKAQKADFQRLAGEADSVSKRSEQYAQYYGQTFSRNEDLRQASQQNIDYAMNILKSASDQVTQTVTSMFRG